MQKSRAFTLVCHPRAAIRPRLTSFDSSQEFSLDHWLEVTCLMQEPEDDLERSFAAEELESSLLVLQ